MPVDIRRNPRISQLLGRARAAAQSLEGAEPESAEAEHLQGVIDAQYAEVGRYIHWLMGQDPETLARIEAEAANYGASAPTIRPMELEVDIAPMDEASEGRTSDVTGNSFSDEEVEVGASMDQSIASSVDSLIEIDPASVEAVSPADIALDKLRAVTTADITWIRSLQLLAERVGAPDEPDDNRGWGVTARRLMNATRNLAGDFENFPRPVQIAVLSYIFARGRQIHEAVGHGPELRMVMGRLHTVKDMYGLEEVRSMTPKARPKHGSWADDSTAWWDALLQGLAEFGRGVGV